MKYVVTCEEMKQYDNNTIDRLGVLSMVLMERAALAVVGQIALSECERVLILCSGGNNGGDGFAIGRMLLQEGKDVTVLFAGDEERMTEDCKKQKEIYEKYAKICKGNNCIVTSFKEQAYDVIIDAFFGIGLSRPIEGKFREWIEKANACDAFKIAVDIPSGVHGDTGKILGISFLADVTVTFGFLKRGLMFYPGKACAGRIVVAPIGITKESFFEKIPTAFSYEREDCNRLSKRMPDGNKGSYGKLSIFAGSENVGGAAILSSMAAYRMGSGYVKVFTHENNRTGFLCEVKEAVCSYYNDAMSPKGLTEMVDNVYSFGNVCLIGPGIGREKISRMMVSSVLTRDEKPLIIDADACNIIADEEQLKNWLLTTKASRNNPIIMTPHLVEFSRLSKKAVSELKEDLVEASMAFSKEYGVILVCKDAVTVVTDEKGAVYINCSGNNAMATAGSGDVLAGMITALAGQQSDGFESACLGVYIHGLCGDLSKDETNERFVVATDLIKQLSNCLKI